MQNYRGLHTAMVVNVLEGDGKETPYQVVKYVLLKRNDGQYESYGKVVPLTPEELAWFDKTVSVN